MITPATEITESSTEKAYTTRSNVDKCARLIQDAMPMKCLPVENAQSRVTETLQQSRLKEIEAGNAGKRLWFQLSPNQIK